MHGIFFKGLLGFQRAVKHKVSIGRGKPSFNLHLYIQQSWHNARQSLKSCLDFLLN